jgi:hypothetical protein
MQDHLKSFDNENILTGEIEECDEGIRLLFLGDGTRYGFKEMYPSEKWIAWDDFKNGDDIQGLTINHVCAAIRYIHRCSYKKLPHPIMRQFFPSLDSDVLTFDTLKNRSCLLFAFWGVLSFEALSVLSSLLDNCMLESIWSSTDKGEELPGMTMYESARKKYSNKDLPYNLSDLVERLEEEEENLKKSMKKASSNYTKNSYKVMLEDVQEKINHYKSRDPNTSWLIDMLEEAFDKKVQTCMKSMSINYNLSLLQVLHAEEENTVSKRRKKRK